MVPPTGSNCDQISKYCSSYTCTIIRGNFLYLTQECNIDLYICVLQDFEDIIIGFTLDDKPKRKTTAPESSESEDGNEDEAPLLKISQQEMISVCEVHRELFTSLTTTLWHQGALQVTDDIDYVQPVITGYQVAALVEKHVAGALCEW